ncbi:class 1 fructose-bisphosphatase [Lichenifustis flavocetrariae]|uniref:Fructose-1,6-bisphosphatase class 1 n=1 Tax=Lichenifustis flavocetrariae TaxID=2949735 RepID=A0AA42CLV3_9HYPH|nr:class 1 fructose-bisphosphatase [Lichenifustis flavocetrariae]MCW6507772.1 class 1 fructose-bisphosphatase [Lichenifustis flavocetrariae]
MRSGLSLHDHLTGLASAGDTLQHATAITIETIAATAITLADLIGRGALTGPLGHTCGMSSSGDLQKALDVEADGLFREALRDCPIAALASEEAEKVEILDAAGGLCVAIDPIDGSGNIDVNMPVGTIFSILPAPAPRSVTRDAEVFSWPAGTSQLAAGFVLYGPQTSLVLTTCGGVDIFTLDRSRRTFRLTVAGLTMPAVPPDEYAINASNYRHWEEPVRSFIDECTAGPSGPYGRDFNMRWHGAVVAEAYRILIRGGLYLYPADAREGYAEGRLRLVYEGFPLAFLVERAGGAATNGRRRILDMNPTALHQHVPLIFGSKPRVEHLTALHNRSGIWPQTTAPLFASRGLFRI